VILLVDWIKKLAVGVILLVLLFVVVSVVLVTNNAAVEDWECAVNENQSFEKGNCAALVAECRHFQGCTVDRKSSGQYDLSGLNLTEAREKGLIW